MEPKKYEWRMASLAKGIDPEAAITELERIENTFGALTPENIVQAASAADSVLHKMFEWDNDRAAFNYRLQQARTLLNNIEVKVLSDGQPRQIPVFEVVKRNDESVYKAVSEFTADDVMQVKRNALREMNYWRSKLSFYKEYESAVQKLDDAIKDLNK